MLTFTRKLALVEDTLDDLIAQGNREATNFWRTTQEDYDILMSSSPDENEEYDRALERFEHIHVEARQLADWFQ